MKLALGIFAAVALALPAGAGARVVDLASAPRVAHVDGQAANDFAGVTVAGAGDVNGDGRPDFVVGAPDADNNGRANSGSAYVVYGGNDPANVDLQQLGDAGFRVDGASAGDNVGLGVAGAGDLNGDGIDDLLVGAPFADQPKMAAGSVYVLYGQHAADLPDLDLAGITTTPSARGVRIEGFGEADNLGTSVAAAGDVNGDGRPDVLLAAPFASNNGRSVSGSVYVLYGGNGLAGINLGNLGEDGFRIDAAEEDDHLGLAAAAGTGDFNGDGVGDVIVGALHSGKDAGAAYVVYGRAAAAPTNVDLAQITTTQAQLGMRIAGAADGDFAGSTVSGGDLNGDGLADAVVGAPLPLDGSGIAYVVYGQPVADPADLSLAGIAGAQAARGMRIVGPGGSEAGTALAATPDLNGDGIEDLLVGAPLAEEGGRDSSGAAFAVYGQPAPDPADTSLGQVATDPSRGLRISGAVSFGHTGAAVGVAGDLDGDGHPDAIVGSPGASNNNRNNSGSADVLDLSGPGTALDSAPSLTNDPTPTFAFHASEPASFQCSVDGGTPSFAACAGPTGSHTVPAPLGDGTYSFRVAALDGFGNPDLAPPVRQFTVDTTPPQTKIAKHPHKVLAIRKGHGRAKARFAFGSSEKGARFSCRLDKRRARPCASPLAFRLKRGPHVFAVSATDRAGNRDPSPAKFKFTVARRQHHPPHP
jgi:FG-GAP repeat protein/Big-like domain-containing protein